MEAMEQQRTGFFVSLADIGLKPQWIRDAKNHGWRHIEDTRPQKGNAWIYLPRTRTLYYPEYGYEVDLETMNDISSIVHWIFHIASKTWAHENNVLADLVASLQAIFGIGELPTGDENGCMVDLDQFEKCLGAESAMWDKHLEEARNNEREPAST